MEEILANVVDENGVVDLGKVSAMAKAIQEDDSVSAEDKLAVAEITLQIFQKAQLDITLGDTGSVSTESLHAEREADPVLDESLKSIQKGIASKYNRERQEEMQEVGITEDELKTVADTALTSCIFGEVSFTLDNAIDRMKQRFDAIVARITSLEHGRYSRISMVRNEIAMGLLVIQRDKLYLASNYKTVYDVAKAILDFSRMQTTSYIRVAKRFIDPKKPVSKFYDNKSGVDFGISQLIQLLKLTDDEIQFCLESGMLDYTTSVSAVKTLIKVIKDKRNQTVDTEALEALKGEMSECQPVIDSYEDFHKAYNALKAHLREVGDTKGADELLPLIMDAVLGFYPKHAFDIKSKWDKAIGIDDTSNQFVTLE